MPRSVEELATLLDGMADSPQRTALAVEYANAVQAEQDADPGYDPAAEPLPEPEQLHGGRVIIKGVSDGSVSSIETLLTEHLGLLLGTDAPVRLNTMSGAIEYDGKAYDLGDLVTRLRLAVERRVCFETRKLDPEGRPIKAKLKIESDNTRAVLLKVAKDNAFSPVQEWLTSLPVVEPGAIKLAATEALGLTSSLDLTLWRKWLIACVARAMDPGCQVDTVLVLVAPRGGERKSSMFRSLIGSAWFSDTHLDMVGFKRENAYMQLHSAWVYEVPELEHARTMEDRSRQKSFISSRSDNFRAPYDDAVRQHRRAVVMGATTNSINFLTGGSDPAYDRRFWPVCIRGKIDTAMVEQLRDQIWAEALAAYRSGETWHLDDTLSDALFALQERQDDLTDEDVWQPILRAYVEAPCRCDKALRLYDVMRHALGFEKSKMPEGDQRRVGAILSRLGWGSKQRRWRVGEKASRRWFDSVTYPEANVTPMDEGTCDTIKVQ